jgi:hypothetical protein
MYFFISSQKWGLHSVGRMGVEDKDKRRKISG